LSRSYPNIYKKDLEKFLDIFLNEIKTALKNDERVELRGWGIFSAKKQKSRKSRDPRTGKEIITMEKKRIHFKNSKELFNKLNEK
tara:strand:+ start:159 stop:413 length:255 start_codon:yes stop_codon:yes gene_type:complete